MNITTQYPEALALVGIAKTVWSGSRATAKISFTLSEKLKAELKKLLNKDIQTAFITDSDVRHIKKKHGQGEAKRGQVDITPEDFALIPFVMNEFDTVEHDDTDAKGNKKLLFKKQVDGQIFTAGIERGNNQIGVITLWKNARPGASC